MADKFNFDLFSVTVVVSIGEQPHGCWQLLTNYGGHINYEKHTVQITGKFKSVYRILKNLL